jgi:uncharacterized membrane protein YkoI
MKRILAFALMLCVICLLFGCSVRKTVQTLDAAEEAVEHRMDAAEDVVEDAIRDAVLPTQAPATNAPANQSDRISPEKAQEIALAQAGFTADQVTRLRVEFEYDDRIPQYDVSFQEGRWEYDYEIHAETGEILSWEKDD